MPTSVRGAERCPTRDHAVPIWSWLVDITAGESCPTAGIVRSWLPTMIHCNGWTHSSRTGLTSVVSPGWP
jgi:hypothetical protein